MKDIIEYFCDINKDNIINHLTCKKKTFCGNDVYHLSITKDNITYTLEIVVEMVDKLTYYDYIIDVAYLYIKTPSTKWYWPFKKCQLIELQTENYNIETELVLEYIENIVVDFLK